MKKIPTLYKRDFNQPGNPITPEFNDGTDWVLAGEGVATRKYDGTSVLIRDHKMYKRYELRPGKIAPTEFEALKAWLENKDIEGLVWHHPDGRMVKIKKKDFRIKR